MGGISIHLTRIAAGLGLVGTLANAAGGGLSLFTLDGAQRMVSAIANDASVQRNAAIAAGVYIGARAVGPSVEKAPLIQLGKLRIYAL
jgi:hypothetical protein